MELRASSGEGRRGRRTCSLQSAATISAPSEKCEKVTKGREGANLRPRVPPEGVRTLGSGTSGNLGDFLTEIHRRHSEVNY